MAVLGQPALGDYVKLEVTIKESYEFKVRSPIRTSVPSLELNSSRSRVGQGSIRDQSGVNGWVLSLAEHPGQTPEKDQPGPGGGGQQLEGAVPGSHHGQLR